MEVAKFIVIWNRFPEIQLPSIVRIHLPSVQPADFFYLALLSK